MIGRLIPKPADGGARGVANGNIRVRLYRIRTQPRNVD